MIVPADYHNMHAWLLACRRPLLIAHRRPDGDALGALAAMALALRALGGDPRPTLFEPLPMRYKLLADAVPWHDWTRERQRLTSECDALVILDTCTYAQLEAVTDYLPSAPPTLVVDHHPTRDEIGTRPDDLRVLDETAGAVCLLLHEWMQSLGLPVSPTIATALLVGVATDSGWFRFANADARMFRAAADLLAAGAPANAIYRAIYEQDPPARLRLIGRMLNTLELYADGRLAVMKLRGADFQAVGADHRMTEDLVNEATRLAGLEAVILFSEEPDGQVRVNLRSKQTLDVAELAARFGGGGHQRAAGARPSGCWEEVVTAVTAAAVAALTNVGGPTAAC